ncbi:SGNH/GDSL hydrolase family protein [Kribbella catacumbae]|uniref:SGNH/GDSL hydrolase family protein n=1 Tax=Kribbella catacumbae TaxID=460086 RepID=UPI00036DF6C9|nr:SGNH/GDSL hydrolase family protein [Kribbella catacumbae]
MRVRRSWFGVAGLLALVGAVVAQVALTPAAAWQLSGPTSTWLGEGPTGNWRAAWLTAMQQPSANWSQQGFAAQSVRQVVRLTAGGAQLRIRVSNQYGDRALRLTGASVAKAAQGAAVEAGSLRPVRFRGAESVSVPVGAQVASDAVALPGVASGTRVAVTLYFADATGPATFHEFGAAGASYRAAGDQRAATTGSAYRESSGSWYFLAGVDTIAAGAGSVVAFGDSITNGYRATPGGRYPDLLAARLAVAGRPMPVLNAGLGGNRLLTESACFGEPGLVRFHRDVLSQPGVRTALVLLGINDLGYPEVAPTPCTIPNPEITPEQLITGYRSLIRNARTRGIRVVGVTLPPFRGAEVHTDRSERIWAAVNTWIRTGGEFDAVADFAAALADPTDPSRLATQYDSGDHLHPNEAGYRAMAEAVDLAGL